MTEYWTLTGKPMRIVPYKNDKIEGLVRQFYDTGQLKKEVPARRDLFHGVEKQYDEEGALIKKRYWVDDQEIPEEEFLKKHKHLAE
jgi:antitoxin component YwqK of YwqJK toxin-antitoxin module